LFERAASFQVQLFNLETAVGREKEVYSVVVHRRI